MIEVDVPSATQVLRRSSPQTQTYFKTNDTSRAFSFCLWLVKILTGFISSNVVLYQLLGGETTGLIGTMNTCIVPPLKSAVTNPKHNDHVFGLLDS